MRVAHTRQAARARERVNTRNDRFEVFDSSIVANESSVSQSCGKDIWSCRMPHVAVDPSEAIAADLLRLPRWLHAGRARLQATERDLGRKLAQHRDCAAGIINNS